MSFDVIVGKQPHLVQSACVAAQAWRKVSEVLGDFLNEHTAIMS